MSAKDLLIGIDAGTSVIKAVAFGLDGQQIALASRRNEYVSLPDGGVEQDMNRTWADTALVLAELVEQVPDCAARCAAIGVTGQGDGTWLIDGRASRFMTAGSGSIPALPRPRAGLRKCQAAVSSMSAPRPASTCARCARICAG